MSRNRRYSFTKHSATPSHESGDFYLIRCDNRKIAEVWTLKGRVKKFFDHGKAADSPWLPANVMRIGNVTFTLAFLTLLDAFDEKTACDMCEGVAFKFLFRDQSYTKADLFALMLEAR